MPDKIPLKFFLTSRDAPITPDHDIWSRPLPVDRRPNNGSSKDNIEIQVSYGAYLSAVGRFLELNDYRTVSDALGHSTGKSATVAKVRGLSVILVKHGEFYHPVRVIIETVAGEYSFVVSGAVSKAGRGHIVGEFKYLAGLWAEFDKPVIPRVFQLDEITTENGSIIPMFSAQWFDGFCEFHLTDTFPGNRSNLVVWDQDESSHFLTRSQAADVYRKVAQTLTTTYNFFTFHHISVWHHAAGDFIVRPINPDRIDLRLITVRKYAPLIENPEPDPNNMIEGLLLFLVNLSLRNRLDRLDGTGDLAWAEDYALDATIDGFFSGLEIMAAKLELPDSFADSIRNYIRAYPPDELQALFSAVADKMPAASPERFFIQARLGEHGDHFRAILAPV